MLARTPLGVSNTWRAEESFVHSGRQQTPDRRRETREIEYGEYMNAAHARIIDGNRALTSEDCANRTRARLG